MKGFTTIEQSKKLLMHGLSSESADMYYFRQIDPDYFPPNVVSIIPTPIVISKDNKPDFNYDIPCWSVGALLDIMPDSVEITKMDVLWVVSASDFHDTICVSLIDALVDKTILLLENNYIKKEK